MFHKVAKYMGNNSVDIEIIEYMLKLISIQLLELFFIFSLALVLNVLIEAVLLTISFIVSRIFVFKNNWHSKNMYFCIFISSLSIVGLSIIANIIYTPVAILFGVLLVLFTQKR